MTSSGSQGLATRPAEDAGRAPSWRAVSAAMVQNQASAAERNGSARGRPPCPARDAAGGGQAGAPDGTPGGAGRFGLGAGAAMGSSLGCCGLAEYNHRWQMAASPFRIRVAGPGGTGYRGV